ncbi:uncharacterized protein LOC126906934 isoform X2 [Daktulosphaira vitifoliae]|nr:uncharacterized protein LOC126906934 isoform X2 [Daktulosphaira vitifoliae]
MKQKDNQVVLKIKTEQTDNNFQSQHVNLGPKTFISNNATLKKPKGLHYAIKKMCTVPFCNSRRRENEKTNFFFKFPKDDNLCAVWIKNCGVEYLIEKVISPKCPRVCEKHFERKMFICDNRLLRTAVPTIFDDEFLKYKELNDSQVALELQRRSVNSEFQYDNINSFSETKISNDVKFIQPCSTQDVLLTITEDHLNETKGDILNYLVFKAEIDKTKEFGVFNLTHQNMSENINNSGLQSKISDFLYEPCTSSSLSSNINFFNQTVCSTNDSSMYQKCIIERQPKEDVKIFKKSHKKKRRRYISPRYLKLSEKYLPNDLFQKVKSHIEKQRSIFGNF